MSRGTVEEAVEAIQKAISPSTEELGAIHACLRDVPAGIDGLLTELLPKIVASRDAPEQLLDHLVDFKLDLDHMRDHLDAASAALQSLANKLEKRIS